jgi:hypothetical protein
MEKEEIPGQVLCLTRDWCILITYVVPIPELKQALPPLLQP